MEDHEIDALELSEQRGLDWDEDHRAIRLFGDVNNQLAFTIWQALAQLQYEDPTAPITIFLNSAGGDIASMLSTVDAIQLCECPIKIIGTGIVMSAAVPILACCKPGHRFLTPRCRLMLHPPRVGLSGIQKNVENAHREMKLLHKMYKDILIQTTKMTPDVVDKYVDNMEDRYFGPQQAVKLGIADSILRRLP